MVRVCAANEQEAEAAASSPFFYTRLRSRIAAERERREAGESWLAMLSVVWRAVPAMALATVFAFVLFLSASTGTGSAGGFIVETLMDTPDAGVEQVVFADRQPLSSDEVLATILSEDEREATR
jgi:hypothetical protein